MAINIFEGGRRVSILLSVALIIGFSVYTLKHYNEYPPYIPVNYVPTDSVESPMMRVKECPPLSFTTPEIKMETKNGTVATVYLCRADSEYEEVMALAIETDKKGVREMQDGVVKKHAALYKHSPMETAQIKAAFVEDEKWVDDQWLPVMLKVLLTPSSRWAYFMCGLIMYPLQLFSQSTCRFQKNPTLPIYRRWKRVSENYRPLFFRKSLCVPCQLAP